MHINNNIIKILIIGHIYQENIRKFFIKLGNRTWGQFFFFFVCILVYAYICKYLSIIRFTKRLSVKLQIKKTYFTDKCFNLCLGQPKWA